jgi:cytochrome b subunit of formate dehydrogenase
MRSQDRGGKPNKFDRYIVIIVAVVTVVCTVTGMGLAFAQYLGAL